jgi:hypothetical protein
VFHLFQLFDDELVIRKDFRSMGLSSAEHFADLEIFGILLVALDQDLVIGTFEVVSALCHCLNNRQQLPILRVVVRLGWLAYSRVENGCAKKPESIVPVMVTSNCEDPCITLQMDQFLRTEMLEYQCMREGHLDLSKRKFGIASALPLL